MTIMSFSKKFMTKFKNIVYGTLDERYTTITKQSFSNIPDLRLFCEQQIQEVKTGPVLRATVNHHTQIMNLCEYWKTLPIDTRITEILVWVHSWLQYTPDKEQWFVTDYWQTFNQTFSKMKGDCEDGSIVILILARLSNIPSNRIKINCGDTPVGGHAYIVYTGDNGVEYPIDWCYWYTNKLLNFRTPLVNDKKYLNIWFGFNDNKVYGKITDEYFKR